MALGEVKVQGGWGRRGGTRRTKGQECMHFVSTLVSTAWRMGLLLRVEGGSHGARGLRDTARPLIEVRLRGWSERVFW